MGTGPGRLLRRLKAFETSVADWPREEPSLDRFMVGVVGLTTSSASWAREGKDPKAAVTRLGAEQRFIKPHYPWTNGRIERLDRTLATEWATRSSTPATRHATTPLPRGSPTTTLTASTPASEQHPSTECHQRPDSVHLVPHPRRTLAVRPDCGIGSAIRWCL
jgi:hypothetical protein